MPSGYSTPLYKTHSYSPKPTPPTYIKPSTPPYLPPSQEAPSNFNSFPEDNTFKQPEQEAYTEAPYNYHANPRPGAQNGNQVRFPENAGQQSFQNPAFTSQDGSLGLSSFASSRPHNDVTQAIIGETGVINNYDASLPVKIPTQKPNVFQVKEILKNADLVYVDGNETPRPSEPNYPTPKPQYNYVPYQPPHQIFDPSQFTFQTVNVDQSNTHSNSQENEVQQNHLDYYDPRDIAFQYSAQAPSSNHLQEQELGTSDTIKIPVAIFKGIRDPNGQGLYTLHVKR